MVLCAERIFMPLISVGSVIFFRVQCAGVMGEREAHLHVGHFLVWYLRYHSSIAREAVCVGREERQIHPSLIGSRPAWYRARVSSSDAVARHVVVVVGLAQLLRRERDLDRAVYGLGDRIAPVLDGQCMP
jgi:hypothetical protein